MKTSCACLIVFACIGLVAGCSASHSNAESVEQMIILQEVNDLLHAASSGGGRAPSSLAGLNRLESMFPRAYAAVKSGDVIVIWGATVKGEGQVGKNETAIAYEKNVPTEGGYVLLSAGTIKKMTAAEFNATAKSGK